VARGSVEAIEARLGKAQHSARQSCVWASALSTHEGRVRSEGTLQALDALPTERQALIYDLHAVVIHSGGAHGGHYTAKIRDVLGEGTWVAPDEPIRQVAESVGKKLYGGGSIFGPGEGPDLLASTSGGGGGGGGGGGSASGGAGGSKSSAGGGSKDELAAVKL